MAGGNVSVNANLESPNNDILKFAIFMSLIILVLSPTLVMFLTKDLYFVVFLTIVGILIFFYSLHLYLKREKDRDDREHALKMKELENGITVLK